MSKIITNSRICVCNGRYSFCHSVLICHFVSVWVLWRWANWSGTFVPTLASVHSSAVCAAMLAETLTSWRDTWGHIQVSHYIIYWLKDILYLQSEEEHCPCTKSSPHSCRWKAIRVLHLPCPLHAERHHEDAYSAETHRERCQVPLPTLWYCHRTQEWPWLVLFCHYYLKMCIFKMIRLGRLSLVRKKNTLCWVIGACGHDVCVSHGCRSCVTLDNVRFNIEKL